MADEPPVQLPALPVPPQPKPRCRALTISGHRCKNNAVDGIHLCLQHYNHRYPALPDPKHVTVPFLEDDSSISLMLTQVAHGLLSNQLDPVRARTTIYDLQVAAYVVAIKNRREEHAAAAAAKAGIPAAPPVPDEQVSRLGYDHEGFVSADGDLPEPNPLCPELNAGPDPWDIADQVHPVNQPAIEQRFADPPSPDGQPDAGEETDDPRSEEQKAKEEAHRARLRNAALYGGRRPKSHYEHPGPGERYYCPSATHGCLGPRYDHCCPGCRRRQKKLDESERDPIPANLRDDFHAVADEAPVARRTTSESRPEPYTVTRNPCRSGNTQNTLPSQPNRMSCLQVRPREGGTP